MQPALANNTLVVTVNTVYRKKDGEGLGLVFLAERAAVSAELEVKRYAKARGADPKDLMLRAIVFDYASGAALHAAAGLTAPQPPGAVRGSFHGDTATYVLKGNRRLTLERLMCWHIQRRVGAATAGCKVRVEMLQWRAEDHLWRFSTPQDVKGTSVLLPNPGSFVPMPGDARLNLRFLRRYVVAVQPNGSCRFSDDFLAPYLQAAAVAPVFVPA